MRWAVQGPTARVVPRRRGTFAEAWLPGGQEDPNATLIKVDIERGECWDSPGSKAASLLSFVKGEGHRRHARHRPRDRHAVSGSLGPAETASCAILRSVVSTGS